jgi:Zn-dependent peptidase ImmA (M78 family)
MIAKSRAREAAKELLWQSKVEKPPVPVERIARRLKAEVRYEPFDGELSGMLFREGGRVIIGVNASHPKTRQRFTIAHELGHMTMHDERHRIHIDRGFPVRRRDVRSSEGEDVEEMEANGFAAELLMPAVMLERDLEGKDPDYEDDELTRWLANRYKVSLQAMAVRLANLRFQN